MTNKQNFLLTFFDGSLAEVKEVNGFILVKARSGSTGEDYVAIYTPESYKKMKSYLEEKFSAAEVETLEDELREELREDGVIK